MICKPTPTHALHYYTVCIFYAHYRFYIDIDIDTLIQITLTPSASAEARLHGRHPPLRLLRFDAAWFLFQSFCR